MTRRQFFFSLIPFILLVLIGFLIYPSERSVEAAGKHTEPKTEVSLAIRANDRDNATDKLNRLTQFINDYLADIEVVPMVVFSVEDVRSAIRENRIDFYLDSPFAVYSLVKEDSLRAIARQWRDGVPQYHSLILVKRQSEIRNLADLEGLEIAFEDPGSSSSYILPASELIEAGLELRKDNEENEPGTVSYSFSSWDQLSFEWLMAGKVEAAAVNSIFYERLDPESRLKVRVLHKSEGIPRHILAASTSVDAATEDTLVSILMSMENSEEGRKILSDFYGTKRFDLIPYEGDLQERMMKILEALGW